MRANGVAAAAHKDLVKEISALKAELKKLSSAMEAEADDGVSRALHTAEAKSKQAIDGALHAAQDFIDDYAEKAGDAAAALRRRTDDLRQSAADALVDSFQTRPIGTLAAIAGIGFLAGYLCRRN